MKKYLGIITFYYPWRKCMFCLTAIGQMVECWLTYFQNTQRGRSKGKHEWWVGQQYLKVFLVDGRNISSILWYCTKYYNMWAGFWKHGYNLLWKTHTCFGWDSHCFPSSDWQQYSTRLSVPAATPTKAWCLPTACFQGAECLPLGCIKPMNSLDPALTRQPEVGLPIL